MIFFDDDFKMTQNSCLEYPVSNFLSIYFPIFDIMDNEVS